MFLHLVSLFAAATTAAAVLFLVLIVVENLIFSRCGGKRHPLLWWMMNRCPLEGEFDAASLPPQSSQVPTELKERSTKVELDGKTFYKFDVNGPGGTAAAMEDSCQLMLATTTVATTNAIPEDLQGIFWMDGNAMAGPIVSMNCSVWNSSDNLLTRVTAYFDWAYLDNVWGKGLATGQMPSGTQWSMAMMPVTFDGPTLQEGRIFECASFNYTDLLPTTLFGEFSLERLPGSGVNFKRGCYWLPAVFGRSFEFGSYTLRKIMNTDGSKVQPAYDKFVGWMETERKGLSLLMHGPEENTVEP
jgi:hypothetical protein